MANKTFMKRVTSYTKAKGDPTPLLLLDVPGDVVECRYRDAEHVGAVVDFTIHIDKGITSSIRHLGVLEAWAILDGEWDEGYKLDIAGRIFTLKAPEALQLFEWLSTLHRPNAPIGPRSRLSPLAV
jgi:hypothetical protein